MMQSGGFEESAEPIPFRCRPRHSTATLSSAWNLCHSPRFERMDLMPGAEGNWPGADSWGRKPGRHSLRTPLSRMAPCSTKSLMCLRVAAKLESSQVRFLRDKIQPNFTLESHMQADHTYRRAACMGIIHSRTVYTCCLFAALSHVGVHARS